MSERFTPEQAEKRFADVIEPIKERRPMPTERLERFSWPLELQGKGETREDGSFLVRYPKGDVFLSFATLIHEAGHLAERERDPSVMERTGHDRLVAEEEGAWRRGWERFKKASPEQLAYLEERFSAFRTEGKLPQCGSFRDLYDWIRENVLSAVEVQRMLFDDSGAPVPDWDTLADELDRISYQSFLERYVAQCVGEIIDDGDARTTIEAIIAEVEREK